MVLIRHIDARCGVVFGLVILLGGTITATRRPLGTIGGFIAPYYNLGLHVARHQTVGKSGAPTVFKPPGYALFVGYLLRATIGPPTLGWAPSRRNGVHEWLWLAPPHDHAYLEKGLRIVAWSQSVVLAMAAAFLYLWLRCLVRRNLALVGAVLFGTCPYAMVLIGTIHFSVLHLLALVAGGLVLQRAMDDTQRTPRRWGIWIAAGVVWGLGKLIRPVTLALPALVLAANVVRFRLGWDGVRTAAWFSFGMAVVIAPYTARNYFVGGAFVPVNAQLWAVLFSATAHKAPAQPNHFRYKEARQQQLEVQSAVAGRQLGRGWEPYRIRENLALEDGYRRAALSNLRAQPSVYLYNLAESSKTLLLDMPTILIDLHSRIQRRPGRWPDWYWPGTPQERLRTLGGRLFLVTTRVLSILALVGIAGAMMRRDTALLAPACVVLAVAGPHAVTWMDLMYYYLKLPFLVLFGFYGIEQIMALRMTRLRSTATLLGWVGIAGVAALGLASTAAVFVWGR